MQQKHKTCPKQWWGKTHILPSEVSKVVIPSTCSSAHTKNKTIGKGDVLLQPEMIYLVSVYVTTFLPISIAP